MVIKKDKLIEAMENIASVAEETATATEEVSASIEEQLAGVEEVVNYTKTKRAIQNPRGCNK